jgi:hypothetical protein
MKGFSLIAVYVVFLGSCKSYDNADNTVSSTDEMSCVSLISQLADLGVKFEEANEASGIYRPRILLNESRAENIQLINGKRVSHLSRVYNNLCTVGQ